MRPRALCFLYYFPPSGGPGVLRGLKFVKYLPELGIDPVVVTVTEGTYDNPEEYTPDPTTLAEVPRGVEVHRVVSREPVRLKRRLTSLRLMRAVQFLLYPAFMERQTLWVPPAIRKGLEIAAKGRVDVVFTSAGPYSSDLVGWRLAERLGVPWVVDHRDPWTTSWALHWPSRLHHRYCEEIERRVLERADVFVANTPGQRDEILARFPSARARIEVIPNGYDEADFAGPAARRDAGRLTILHAGSFDARVLGGVRPSALRRWLHEGLEYRNRVFDRSTHGPLDLLRGIVDLKAREPETASRVRVVLLGSGMKPWLGSADALGLGGTVEAPGAVPHGEAVARMRSADLLFLPTTSRTDGRPVSRVSQKLYEYLRAGPPVLAVTGRGDTRDLLRKAGGGFAVPPGRIDGVAAAIGAVARAKFDGEPLPFVRRDEVVERYERRRLAERLAEVFRATKTGSS